MSSKLKLVLLLSGLLAGCASHQIKEKSPAPTPVTPFQAVQVQVTFATPAHSDYLATQLVNQLTKHGVNATVLTSADAKATRPGPNSALLQLTLTGTWTETFISHRYKHRRSLTQMRGRIPRESPRFRSDTVLIDLQTGESRWQRQTVTAGAWYSDFQTIARSLAKKLVQQLHREGLIATAVS